MLSVGLLKWVPGREKSSSWMQVGTLGSLYEQKAPSCSHFLSAQGQISRLPSGPQGQVGANPAPTPRFLSIHSHRHPTLFSPSRFHATGAPHLVARRNMWVLWGRKNGNWGSRQICVDVGGEDRTVLSYDLGPAPALLFQNPGSGSLCGAGVWIR